MELTIPIYVEKTSSQFGSGAEFVVRPLFLGAPVERSERLQSAMQKLSMALRRQLTDLGRRPQHDELARWSFLPKFSTKQCKVRIEVEGHSARLRLLVVTMSLWGRRIAFIPICPDVWFDLQREESVEERLVAVLTEFIKQRWKTQPGEGVAAFECWSLSGSAFVTELELEWTPPRLRKLPTLDNRLFLGSREALEGEWELYRVGRCLNQLYPDGLDRARQREAEVEELQRLLLAEDRRPILLLGRPQSGKTAVLHEHVFRQVAKTRRAFDNRQAVWLLSPQRLISGMSYVGQWEERFHAIITYAAQRDLTLYIDDLLGLFHAGVTDQSSISVGSLLKEVLEKRRVRVVGELTPGAWHVLQERDRGFASLFHVLPIADVEGDNNLRILFELQRQLEFQHRVRFHLDAIPTIIDLQRRYNPTPAFPGKGAAMLQRLAVRGDEEAASQNEKSVSLISRQSVLRLMHQQSGLPLSFLDRRQTLSPAEIEAGLRERFVGQPQAVAAAVEIIGIARARLNDPTRPLGSLLLLGPTGVGKTEFAKSLASFLFGRPDRLLRFDMNEFVSPNAVPLLTGTFDQPEGLLTAAVRRQPFAVLLFDEIEKGHPALLDLLLQVLGEARLTDARGRTTDFTNTLIVLTSNLGTRRTESDLGFGMSRAPFAALGRDIFKPRLPIIPQQLRRFCVVIPEGTQTSTGQRRIAFDPPIDNGQIQVSVQIQIEGRRSKSGTGEAGRRDPRPGRSIPEGLLPRGEVENVDLTPDVGDEEVKQRIAIEVPRGDSHAGLRLPQAIGGKAPVCAGFAEPSVCLLQEQGIGMLVVRDINVGSQIAVEIPAQQSQPGSHRAGRQAADCGNIQQHLTLRIDFTQIAVELAQGSLKGLRPAVVRPLPAVIARISRKVIEVIHHIQIEKPVPIVVEESRGRAPPRVPHRKLLAGIEKGAVPLVVVQHIGALAADEQVAVPIAVIIANGQPNRVAVDFVEASTGCDFPKGTLRKLPVKPHPRASLRTSPTPQRFQQHNVEQPIGIEIEKTASRPHDFRHEIGSFRLVFPGKVQSDLGADINQPGSPGFHGSRRRRRGREGPR